MHTKHELDSEDLLFIEQGLALLVTSGFFPKDLERQRYLLQRLKLEAMIQNRPLAEEAIK